LVVYDLILLIYLKVYPILNPGQGNAAYPSPTTLLNEENCRYFSAPKLNVLTFKIAIIGVTVALKKRPPFGL
jgi:hypothetical protein